MSHTFAGGELPDEITVCGRVRDGFACRGVLWQPAPGEPESCYKCSASGPGVRYARVTNAEGGEHVIPHVEPVSEPAKGAQRLADAPLNTETCARCAGCGQLADTDDEEPWTAWTALPLHSSAAVLAGIVKPKPCPRCGGTGVVTIEELPF